MPLQQGDEPLYCRHLVPVIGRDLVGPEVIDKSRELIVSVWPDGVHDLSKV